MDACTKAPCKNGGNCVVTGDNKHSCSCNKGFFGENCERARACNVINGDYNRWVILKWDFADLTFTDAFLSKRIVIYRGSLFIVSLRYSAFRRKMLKWSTAYKHSLVLYNFLLSTDERAPTKCVEAEADGLEFCRKLKIFSIRSPTLVTWWRQIYTHHLL